MLTNTLPTTPSESLFWVVLGDLHDNYSLFNKIPELPYATGVIVTGDITFIGGIPQARKVLETLECYNSNILAQIGNMDKNEITDWLEGKGWNIHITARNLTHTIAIMGVGGSTFTPFGTPSEFPESYYTGWLNSLWKNLKKYQKVILVTHTPPYNTLCDAIYNNSHVGSIAIREFIIEAQPDICLCGHNHESRGIDYIGKTLIVNPGLFSSGGYALLHINSKGDISVSLHELTTIFY